MTQLEKRLIVLSQLGIRIEHRDGHRWIEYTPSDTFDFEHMLKMDGILLNNKIYGTLEDALNIIDRCLTRCNVKTLLENFWYEEREIIGEGIFDETRIDYVEQGQGGLV